MNRVWCEINSSALEQNARTFRRLLDRGGRLSVAVKADAYGHGLLIAARAFLRGGAGWLCVDSLSELATLRDGGIDSPVYVMGYVPLCDLEDAVQLSGRIVVYNRETIEGLSQASERTGLPARVHLKLETGNNRQGVDLDEALALAALCRERGVVLEGLATHFANIEDTTDHRFARDQLRRFLEGVEATRAAGYEVPMCHLANSAATILWPEAQLDMVRVGISAYGLWPSSETYVSAFREGREGVALHPALTWKSLVAQLKSVSVREFVGYGCTYMATRPTRLAIVPVGYYDGYDRRLSNLAHVLVKGVRAPVRGRVCMNMIMVDVTDVPGVGLEDEVVLLGGQGEERIAAEQLAEWAGTINYEIVTRIAAHVPRLELAVTDEERAGAQQASEPFARDRG